MTVDVKATSDLLYDGVVSTIHPVAGATVGKMTRRFLTISVIF
jgi:hypothetical protein